MISIGKKNSVICLVSPTVGDLLSLENIIFSNITLTCAHSLLHRFGFTIGLVKYFETQKSL